MQTPDDTEADLGRLPAWWAFVRNLSKSEVYTRPEELPAEAPVDQARACWSKDGMGVHLFLDVTVTEGPARWRLYLPKRHPALRRVLAGQQPTRVKSGSAGVEFDFAPQA